jgi:acyl-CoA reductase-like NAD-dependent aldehyde dehydrogenase
MPDPKKFLVGGEWRASKTVAPVKFPYTAEVFAEIYQAADADLDDAIEAARRGFEITRKMPLHQRSAILRKFYELMDARSEELADTLTMEGGKAKKVARGEVARAKQTVLIASEEARRIGGEVINMDWTKDGEDRTGLVRRFPIGIVLGIAPFNYPLNLSCHKVAPAIAAGNAVILKPSPWTPLSGLIMGEMLLEAGFPPEALSIINCTNAQTEKMVMDDRVAMFSFTGSSAVGWMLRSKCGRKRAALELGGNAAAIVHEDADLAYASKRIAMGGFLNAGQNCISVQRVLIHKPVYHEMLETMVDDISALNVGDPRDEATDVGPMISVAAAEKAEAWVEEAVSQGAQKVLGGKRVGNLFPPTVLAETKPEMKVSCLEIFAPVITAVQYENFDEAIRLANATEYGLQGGLFTQDMNRIMKGFEEIEVGGLQINEVSTFRMDHMPYGGVKGSGLGREGVRYAIEEMTEPKLLVMNLGGGK